MTAPPINLTELRADIEEHIAEWPQVGLIHVPRDYVLALLDAVEAACEVNEAIKQAELTPEGSNLDLRAVVALGQALARFQP
jgi:hypothetical protein